MCLDQLWQNGGMFIGNLPTKLMKTHEQNTYGLLALPVVLTHCLDRIYLFLNHLKQFNYLACGNCLGNVWALLPLLMSHLFFHFWATGSEAVKE